MLAGKRQPRDRPVAAIPTDDLPAAHTRDRWPVNCELIVARAAQTQLLRLCLCRCLPRPTGRTGAASSRLWARGRHEAMLATLLGARRPLARVRPLDLQL